MAAAPVNIYLDMDMKMFVDPQRKTPFPGPLYQHAVDPTVFYSDKNLSVPVNLIELDFKCENIGPESRSSPAPSPSSPPTNDGFTKDHTLFLIDLMRQHVTSDGDSLPRTLQDLNARLKTAKPKKKMLWSEAAQKLGEHFHLCFCPEKVARKWNTLMEAYKKVKDNSRTPGKATTRFQFLAEMDDLLGVRHDVVFPVIGSSEGLEVRREALGKMSSSSSSTAAVSETSSALTKGLGGGTPPPPTAHIPHKRRRVDDEVMEFLQQSEAASQRRHEETIAQLRSAQQGFETLMNKLLDKL
ncbi:hypothetical protein JOB18_041519 [Solea senegalensis]|uniref:Myb/SANT-like DNA-binding domain-containing protein n=1 Tax=Solea senegalensis TaxID=28829 RepID=A0AAV6PHM8_SOLSE|nr:uncharacterized protein LOC122761725 isoform X2 [Solea senegalensis]KAG7463225.1 hypothetical protein JOB18_041519 [Solea senegalensis]